MRHEERTPLHALYRRIAGDRDAVWTDLREAIDGALRDLEDARDRLARGGDVDGAGVVGARGLLIDRLCGEYMRLDALAKETDRLLTAEEEGGGADDPCPGCGALPGEACAPECPDLADVNVLLKRKGG